MAKQLNITINEGNFKPELLEQADSAFLCGTAAEVIGVNSFNSNVFPIEWKNSLGKKLQTIYKNLVLEKELLAQNT